MTGNNALIDSIQQKINKLVKQYAVAQEENKQQREVLNDKDKIIAEQKLIINQLEDKITILKLTKSLGKGKENSDAKLKINEMIREIDRCIGLIKS
jgi:hypothetical protein